MPTVRSRTVGKAAEITGGLKALAFLLRVPVHDIECYIEGTKEVPTVVFLSATDIVMAESSEQLSRSHSATSRPSSSSSGYG